MLAVIFFFHSAEFWVHAKNHTQPVQLKLLPNEIFYAEEKFNSHTLHGLIKRAHILNWIVHKSGSKETTSDIDLWQTAYALAVPKNLGVAIDFWLCSEGNFLSGLCSPWLAVVEAAAVVAT